MQDHFLKATDEANLYDVLLTAGLVTKYYDPQDPLNVQAPIQPGVIDETPWQPTGSFRYVPTQGINLDVIGVINLPTGNTISSTMSDGTAFTYPEMAPIPGYHANIRADLTEEQLADIASITITAPKQPVRVWA